MNYLLFKLIIPREIRSPDDGRTLLSRFLEAFPEHLPETFGFCEPLEHVFDEGDIKDVLQLWESSGFIAERKRYPAVLIDVSPSLSSPYTPHRTVFCTLQFKTIKAGQVTAIREFVYGLSNSFQAIHTAAHISTPEEAVFGAKQQLNVYESHPDKAKAARHIVERLRQTLESRSPFTAQLTHIKTKRLKENIPNIFWLTVFGPPYVELFGEEKILTTPSHGVRKLPYGGIGVQLTETIEDTPEAWQNFLSVRRGAKEHLNSNAFFDPTLPRRHIYNAPDFGIPKKAPGERRRTLLTLAGGEAMNKALADSLFGKKTE